MKKLTKLSLSIKRNRSQSVSLVQSFQNGHRTPGAPGGAVQGGEAHFASLKVFIFLLFCLNPTLNAKFHRQIPGFAREFPTGGARDAAAGEPPDQQGGGVEEGQQDPPQVLREKHSRQCSWRC